MPNSLRIPQLSAVSCPTSSACYLAGTQAVGQRFGKHGYNGGSAMVLVTANAGVSWSRVTFPVPAGRISGDLQGALEDIGSIQCPRIGRCVALGVADQGSHSTPVYTDGVAP